METPLPSPVSVPPPPPAISLPEEKSLPPFSVLVKTAFRVWREHALAFIKIGVAPLAAASLVVIPQFSGIRFPLLFFTLSVVSVLVSILFTICMFIAISEGMALPSGVWGTYKRAGKLFFPFAWMSLLGIATAVGGMVLLFVPGILVGARTAFSSYTFLVDSRRGLAAHTLSWFIVRGHTLSVFWRILVLVIAVYVPLAALYVLIGFVSALVTGQFAPGTDYVHLRAALQTPGSKALPVPVLLFLSLFNLLASAPLYFIAIPIIYIFAFLLYQSLKEMRGAPAPEEEQKIRKTLKILGWLGVASVLIIGTIVTIGVLLIALLSSHNRTGPY